VVAEIVRGKTEPAAYEEIVEAAAWSIVHGLTVLLADQQIRSHDGSALTKRAQMSLANSVTALFCNGLARNLAEGELPVTRGQ
jgi:hypothetical protein